ncbi:MAG: DUF1501 domain-containing protein, partial [Bryobacterales bacterium]|nr:DUF1501 domain-containing protein [Bryobacterales bacterium]
HDDIRQHAKMARDTDGPIAALVDDLKSRGLFNETLILISGEFGRTPMIQNSGLEKLGNGRDHNVHAWTALMAGGGIKGGIVVGASDEKGYNVTDRVVTMGDLYATIYKALGIDWKKEYMTPIGRPIKIANSLEDKTGEPIKELLA